MADISHLEKMGRELKCPICLSLLNSAVSLTCNHVFCNSCIQTSMKSASNCPVCKVPYNRREIRPAPHMDNLVNIYKNMEVASGVNIFVSQTIPSTKLPVEDNQSNGEGTSGLNENAKPVTEAPVTNTQKRNRGKGSKRSLKCTSKNSRLNSVRPSFPAKKRVQVPLYPPSETPPSTKLVGRKSESVSNVTQKPLVIEKDRPMLNENREPVLSPFFWLREEEDVEKISQQIDGEIIMDTPPTPPCFSDMKDSDDEVPCEVTPKSGTHTAANEADLFDSEMFEWTQRACSPELCRIPSNIQIEDNVERAGVQAKTNLGDSVTKESGALNKKYVTNENCADNGQSGSPSLSYPENETIGTEGGAFKSRRRTNKALEITKKKRGKRTIVEVSEVHNNSQQVTVVKKNENSTNAFNMKKKDSKNKKKGNSERKVTASVTEDIFTSCGVAKRLRQNNKSTSLHLSALVEKEEHTEGSYETIELKTGCKPRKESFSEQNKNCITSKRRQRTAKYTTRTGDEALCPVSENQLIPMDNDGKATSTGTQEKKFERECDVKHYGKKRVRFSVDEQVADKENITHGNIQQPVHNSLETEKSVLNSNGLVLRKCEADHYKIQCNFCHSAEDSEASGVMVHYLNGKPVKDDNGASGVIHVHKHCAEWAPNVYFEDDDVINLEPELKRSRRITCSLCGVKGAALGCYETSCRKSFHVPCAKLTPKCRWDYDNFVMLCPQHAICKLPCEVPEHQSKKKQSVKRDSCIHQAKISETPDNSASLQWKSQKKYKSFVLCCSALVDNEKEIVTSFRRLFGVTVVKTWDISVTHVITSTDEKGACRRTLKYLMGVLAGKWILSIEWIKACLEATEFVGEQQYEIECDIHGIADGPRLGRLRLLNKQPKLFNGYKFFFMGDFLPSYKQYLHDLVIAAGGMVLNRKPVAGYQDNISHGCPQTFIIYSHEQLDKYGPSDKTSILEHRRLDAEALASSTGAVAASNSWILNCIAGSKLQTLE